MLDLVIDNFELDGTADRERMSQFQKRVADFADLLQGKTDGELQRLKNAVDEIYNKR